MRERTGPVRRGAGDRGGPRMGHERTWPDPDRYETMSYRRCGRSGLRLPAVSLGLWHNFGHGTAARRRARDAAHRLRPRHHPLRPGQQLRPAARLGRGAVRRGPARDLAPYRDELVISTKAGYLMWDGPYGEWGSRKYLLASLDQSLDRMGLDYVDIFYSHRFDPDTPLEETMGALATAVQQGKALYAGVSSYSAAKTREAERILREMGVPLLIHQPSYSMLNRWIEPDLLDALEDLGVGAIVFSPLAQGLLTDKYLGGVPDARPARPTASGRSSCARGPREGAGPERDRRRARPVAGADGAGLVPARPADHVGADRRQQRRADRRERRGARAARLRRRRARRHRPQAADSGLNIWARSHEAG
jgi:L-glyceraldehyde 3-phosphate reductase